MSISPSNKIYKKAFISNVKKHQKNILPSFSDILSIPSNPEDIFTLICPIGHGAFGSVYKAIHKETKKIYAIKIIQYFKEDQNLLTNLKHMENINFCYKTVQEETSLMRLVNSSNYIVKYYGSYFSRQTNTLWLILEFCASGSVIDLMLAMDRTYTEIEIATIIKMVLKGLIIIHEKNLIHRDVKGANILLSGEGYAKIGDFGVGVKLQEDFRKSRKGSPYWMSPQVVNNESYGIGTDIWSLGITCLELFNGEPPNSSLKPIEVMEKIGKKRVNYKDLFGDKKMSECFKNFVKKCLVIDEKKRGKAKELINDEFIVKYAKDNIIMKNLYQKHINDLDEYRREVEEYELELKMKQKKEFEKNAIMQQQKENQNMSIECDMEDNKENININKNKDIDEEILFNQSLNSIFFNNNNDNNEEIDYRKLNNDCINTISNNDSLKYFDNYTNEFRTHNIVSSSKGNIFDNDDEKIASKVISSNNINTKKEYNLSSDIVNLSSNLNKKSNLINKTVDIKEYSIESNFTNKSYEKFRNNSLKTSGQKTKKKCRVINFTKPMMDKQKDYTKKILNKTMDDKRMISLNINESLILSYSSTNKVRKGKMKSLNLVNNIKSLSILSNSKVLKNTNKNEETLKKYRAIKTEENIKENNIFPLLNLMQNTVKNKNHKNIDKKSNRLNITTDNSNTYDNSNSKPNSTFNTNNNINFSKITNNLNLTNSIYTKKNNSQNLMRPNKENLGNNNINKNKSANIKNKIPISNGNTKSFLEKNNILDKNQIIEKKIKNIEINNNKNKEDINDSDDDGILNNINNFEKTYNLNKQKYKENILHNIQRDNMNDDSTITNNSVHSYSIIDSIEFIRSINKNNIYSYAHKKYFS